MPRVIPEEGSLTIPDFPEGVIDYKVSISLGGRPDQGAWRVFIPSDEASFRCVGSILSSPKLGPEVLRSLQPSPPDLSAQYFIHD